jgi:hypothetical protein
MTRAGRRRYRSDKLPTPRALVPGGPKVETQVIRILVISCALLAFSACSQMQESKCVRDMVRSNEPYQTHGDRDDSEVMAKQICRQRTEGKSSR